jgi:glycosyltransferase involved in cell wall biosynthesis
MGGSERNITHLLEGVSKDRFRIYLARFAFPSVESAENVRDKNDPVLKLSGAGIYTLSGLRNLVFLKKFVSEKKISLIVTYHESSDFYGLALSIICDIPVISSRRDMSFKTRLHHRIAFRLAGKYFDSVIAVSNAVKQEMLKNRWFPEEKMLTIYNGIKTGDYGNRCNGISLKGSLGIHDNSPVVGMVSNIHKIKGIPYFLDASRIIHKHKPDVQFLIIGYEWVQTGFLVSELKRYGEEIGMSKNLHFLGGRRDVADLISIFDVAVLASLSEGFSNVILEYMASSKPVVATQVGGNSEVVVHGETGLLVPPADADALADSILFFLEDKDTALKFGLAGKKRIEQRFELGEMIKQYENVFEMVILKCPERNLN